MVPKLAICIVNFIVFCNFSMKMTHGAHNFSIKMTIQSLSFKHKFKEIIISSKIDMSTLFWENLLLYIWIVLRAIKQYHKIKLWIKYRATQIKTNTIVAKLHVKNKRHWCTFLNYWRDLDILKIALAVGELFSK